MNLAPAHDQRLQDIMAQGYRERYEEAYREGYKKGYEEMQMTIARRIVRRDRPLEEIAQDTGLSIEVLEALRSDQTPIVNELAGQ